MKINVYITPAGKSDLSINKEKIRTQFLKKAMLSERLRAAAGHGALIGIH